MVAMHTEDRGVEPVSPPPTSPQVDSAPAGAAAQAASVAEEPAYAAPPSASPTPPLRYPEQMTGSVVDTLV